MDDVVDHKHQTGYLRMCLLETFTKLIYDDSETSSGAMLVKNMKKFITEEKVRVASEKASKKSGKDEIVREGLYLSISEKEALVDFYDVCFNKKHSNKSHQQKNDTIYCWRLNWEKGWKKSSTIKQTKVVVGVLKGPFTTVFQDYLKENSSTPAKKKRKQHANAASTRKPMERKRQKLVRETPATTPIKGDSGDITDEGDTGDITDEGDGDITNEGEDEGDMTDESDREGEFLGDEEEEEEPNIHDQVSKLFAEAFASHMTEITRHVVKGVVDLVLEREASQKAQLENLFESLNDEVKKIIKK